MQWRWNGPLSGHIMAAATRAQPAARMLARYTQRFPGKWCSRTHAVHVNTVHPRCLTAVHPPAQACFIAGGTEQDQLRSQARFFKLS